jgi:hypothetical protein
MKPSRVTAQMLEITELVVSPRVGRTVAGDNPDTYETGKTDRGRARKTV